MRRDLLAAIIVSILIAAPTASAEPKDVAPEPVPPPKSPAHMPHAGEPVKVDLPEEGEGASLLWKHRWHKFSDAEWVVTGVSLAVTLGSLFVPPATERWKTGGLLIDERARRGLRPESEGWRFGWRDTSDVLLSIATTYPYLVDAVVVAGWHRRSRIVAEQMALMNMEAMALTAGIQGLISAFASRERPYGRDCIDVALVESRDCVETNRYRSFFSGHTSQAFVAAALTCAHHANLPLYGSRTADQLACVSMFGLATAVGMMRVTSDQHYVSDVTVGALIGTLVGFGVPYLFHYHSSERAPKHGLLRPFVGINITPSPNGLMVGGVFG